MPPIAVWSFLRGAGALALKNWRVVLALVAALLIWAYVHDAEQAKDELNKAKGRTAAAESLAKNHEKNEKVLSGTIDSLKKSAAAADSEWQAAIDKLKMRRPLPAKLATTPADGTAAPAIKPVLSPADSPDNTNQMGADTSNVLRNPKVQELIRLCDNRVSIRDAIIKKQDERHTQDTLLIRQLRILTTTPVLVDPPRTPSRWSRIALGAGAGLVGGYLGKHYTGDHGLIVGATAGAMLGLIR